jgi:hypothetical protein
VLLKTVLSNNTSFRTVQGQAVTAQESRESLRVKSAPKKLGAGLVCCVSPDASGKAREKAEHTPINHTRLHTSGSERARFSTARPIFQDFAPLTVTRLTAGLGWGLEEL